MSDQSASAMPSDKGGNDQSATNKAHNEGNPLPQKALEPSRVGSGKKSFPPSKQVDFAGALGLVVWVWSEMIETHEIEKLSVQWIILTIFYIPVFYYSTKWFLKFTRQHSSRAMPSPSGRCAFRAGLLDAREWRPFVPGDATSRCAIGRDLFAAASFAHR
jgi:hypothetical protein